MHRSEECIKPMASGYIRNSNAEGIEKAIASTLVEDDFKEIAFYLQTVVEVLEAGLKEE